MKITDRVRAFAEPVVEEYGCSLWDVEYIREGGEWFLRLYIDKDGGVNINDCVEVSHAMDPILDREDPIEGSYRFEVVSAGLERPLNGVREYPAVLRGYDNGDVTVEYGGETLTFSKSQVALVRLRVDFS